MYKKTFEPMFNKLSGDKKISHVGLVINYSSETYILAISETYILAIARDAKKEMPRWCQVITNLENENEFPDLFERYVI
jgi:hypothetical protein